MLTEQQVDHLFNETQAFNGYQVTIDLEAQVVRTPDAREYAFEISGFRKYCMINGYDDIGLTLAHADKIGEAIGQPRIDVMPHAFVLPIEPGRRFENDRQVGGIVNLASGNTLGIAVFFVG